VWFCWDYLNLASWFDFMIFQGRDSQGFLAFIGLHASTRLHLGFDLCDSILILVLFVLVNW
jgi:hypothetical protein